MPVSIPRFLVLDSSTLVALSRDYWAQENSLRNKSRSFLDCLLDQGVFIAFTFTHLVELFRYENEVVVWKRLGFLRAVPLVAWLRPYSCDGIPGSFADLLLRELHAVVHSSAQNWREIVLEVQSGLWRTGTGSELFEVNSDLWSCVRDVSARQHENEKLIASLGRTGACDMMATKFGDVLRMPTRPAGKQVEFSQRYVQELKAQLDRHGDPRLTDTCGIANLFKDTVDRDVSSIERMGGDFVLALLEYFGVPRECVTPEMTVGEIGALGTWVQRLKVLSARLRPSIKLTILDVPPETLPSCVVEKKLSDVQRKATRVRGSDLGDGQIAPLSLYADIVEVDKRTFEYLNQIRRNNPSLSQLMKQVLRSSDYEAVMKLLTS